MGRDADSGTRYWEADVVILESTLIRGGSLRMTELSSIT